MNINRFDLRQAFRLLILYTLLSSLSYFLYPSHVTYEQLKYGFSNFNFYTINFFLLNGCLWALSFIFSYQPLIDLAQYIKVRKRDKYQVYLIYRYILSIAIILAINFILDLSFSRLIIPKMVIMTLFGSLATVIALHISKFNSKVVFVLIGLNLVILYFI